MPTSKIEMLSVTALKPYARNARRHVSGAGRRLGGRADARHRLAGPLGARVPAADLEDLVATTIATHLRDEAWVCGNFASGLDLRQTGRLIAAARALGDRVTSQDAMTDPQSEMDPSTVIRPAVSHVIVGPRRLTIAIDAGASADLLADVDDGLGQLHTRNGTIAIAVDAQALRCGRQVRLVIGAIETDHRTPDPQLVGLITDAHRWFEDLRTARRATIAEIAARDRQQVSHVSRAIGLAFLAPDIVGMILTGRQPIGLTPERLKACRPLPLDWSKQRAILLG